MKGLKLILSVTAITLAVGAIVCAVIAYWDNLLGLYDGAKGKLLSKRRNCSFCADDDGFSDFVDVE